MPSVTDPVAVWRENVTFPQLLGKAPPRAGGDPSVRRSPMKPMDSRLRGNDGGGSSRRQIILFVLWTILATTTTVGAQLCGGDCDHDGRVGVNELVTGVNF